MSNLAAFKSNDGIEIYIDTITGESFCSVRGYARMSGISDTAVRKRLGANQIATKRAQTQTAGGLQGANLLDEKTITTWLAKDNPEMLTKFAQVGVRMFLHQMAGYQVVSTAVAKPVEAYTRRQLLEMQLEAELKLEAQQQEINTLVEVVSALEPKAIAWEQIASVDGLIKLNDFAGALGIGRTTLTRKLVELGVFFNEVSNGKRRNRAYAKFINKGYFYEKMTDISNRHGDLLYTEFTTYVTKAGAEYLSRRLDK